MTNLILKLILNLCQKKTLIIIGSVIFGLAIIVAISIFLASTTMNSSFSSTEDENNVGFSGGLSKAGPLMKSKTMPDSETRKTEKMMETKQDAQVKSTRLVIKTGTINVVVKNITDSAKNIIQYTKSKGGWVVSNKITEQEETHEGKIIIRVPAEIFNESLVYFKGLAGKVSYEEIQGQDVTEEYTDLQSNLKNLEATESQLRKIMETSGTIPDILAVQKELTIVRGQIEQIKGRMQYLKENVEMATITINLALSEELLPISSSDKWHPAYVIKQAWSSFLGFLKGFSYLLIWIVIYAIIVVPVIIIIRVVNKILKKRKVIREGNKKT